MHHNTPSLYLGKRDTEHNRQATAAAAAWAAASEHDDRLSAARPMNGSLDQNKSDVIDTQINRSESQDGDTVIPHPLPLINRKVFNEAIPVINK
ncbi:hypothetical protein E2C01_076783 [Portunus trituberculatus]|uniref:Uncharacterized protein n=1 Tax=Portunus trituberculatus TaxID=210409 RepID=A0A5B7IKK2_PORTR|nr:hypothetical protein [Portunus trituberculatus]